MTDKAALSLYLVLNYRILYLYLSLSHTLPPSLHQSYNLSLSPAGLPGELPGGEGNPLSDGPGSPTLSWSGVEIGGSVGQSLSPATSPPITLTQTAHQGQWYMYITHYSYTLSHMYILFIWSLVWLYGALLVYIFCVFDKPITTALVSLIVWRHLKLLYSYKTRSIPTITLWYN